MDSRPLTARFQPATVGPAPSRCIQRYAWPVEKATRRAASCGRRWPLGPMPVPTRSRPRRRPLAAARGAPARRRSASRPWRASPGPPTRPRPGHGRHRGAQIGSSQHGLGAEHECDDDAGRDLQADAAAADRCPCVRRHRHSARGRPGVRVSPGARGSRWPRRQRRPRSCVPAVGSLSGSYRRPGIHTEPARQQRRSLRRTRLDRMGGSRLNTPTPSSGALGRYLSRMRSSPVPSQFGGLASEL